MDPVGYGSDRSSPPSLKSYILSIQLFICTHSARTRRLGIGVVVDGSNAEVAGKRGEGRGTLRRVKSVARKEVLWMRWVLLYSLLLQALETFAGDGGRSQGILLEKERY